ncbi:hypothetical protein [Streptomyces sp. NPDC086023]|uniref:hypothetical protein n=1 Tax=Streptomyces sp. NPDC086023 TaxID=3365746 RepID=UPI0037D97D19
MAAVSATLGIAEKTVAGAHGFLGQNGLFEPGCQTFILTAAGLRLAELRTSDSARARLFLRELWGSSWFTLSTMRLLDAAPQDVTTLAEHLTRGISRRIERGLHLVHWLEYALVVHKEEGGQMALLRETQPPQPALPFIGSSHAVAALPRERFLEVMSAYRAIARAFAPPQF